MQVYPQFKIQQGQLKIPESLETPGLEAIVDYIVTQPSTTYNDTIMVRPEYVKHMKQYAEQQARQAHEHRTERESTLWTEKPKTYARIEFATAGITAYGGAVLSHAYFTSLGNNMTTYVSNVLPPVVSLPITSTFDAAVAASSLFVGTVAGIAAGLAGVDKGYKVAQRLHNKHVINKTPLADLFTQYCHVARAIQESPNPDKPL